MDVETLTPFSHVPQGEDHHAHDSQCIRGVYKQLTMSVGPEKALVCKFQKIHGHKYRIYWYSNQREKLQCYRQASVDAIDMSWKIACFLTQKEFCEYYLNRPWNPSRRATHKGGNNYQ